MSQRSAAGRPTLAVGGWLLVLCLILAVWNPASLAMRLAARVMNLSSQTTLSLWFLAARLMITSVGVAAGRALWLRRPRAVLLAKIALVLSAIEAVVRLSARVGLTEAPPGTRFPLALFVILHNAAWYLYLQKSRRVRATYGPDS
jgi:hypothetical protein